MTKDFSEGFVSLDIDTEREGVRERERERVDNDDTRGKLKITQWSRKAIYKLDLKVYIELISDWLTLDHSRMEISIICKPKIIQNEYFIFSKVEKSP